MSTPLRRSTRDRKQASNFINESSLFEEDPRTNSSKKRSSVPSEKKRQRRVRRKKQEEEVEDDNGSTNDNEMEVEEEEPEENEEEEQDDEENLSEPEEEQNDEEEEPEEPEEEESDEEEEEEEYTPQAAAKKAKRPRSSPASSSPKPKPVAKTRKFNLSTNKKTTTTAIAKATKRLPNKKTVQVSLDRFAKKFLDAKETPTTSLVAALLTCHKASSSSSSLSKALREKQTPYTANLALVVQQFIQEHQNDPNAAQVALYNLLFRSVGASHAALWDPVETDLENMSDEELDEQISEVIASMEDIAPEDVLLILEGDGKNTNSAQGKSPAIREYQGIYREFWYLLGAIALSDSLAGNNSAGLLSKTKQKSSRKSKGGRGREKDSDDSSSDEEEQDDEDSAAQAPQGFRFQIEMIREMLTRMIELSCLPQNDLRCGTLVATYDLSVAVLERTVELREKLRVADRQLHVAQKSRMKRKAQALESQIESWNRMCTDLEEIVSEMVMGVFVKRYKDIHPQIRKETLGVLHKYVLIRPDLFLKNTYLKYFGWMLSDKSAMVREEAIAGLLAPFKANAESSVGSKRNTASHKYDTKSMESMADKFAVRLADCTMDVDETVQERALELLLAFARDHLLDSFDDEAVWKQINQRAIAKETTPAVRRIGLEFVIEQLEAFDRPGSAQSEAEASKRIHDLATWTSHCLVSDSKMSTEKIPFNLVGYIVSSMRALPRHKSLVTDYAAMLRALKDSNDDSQSQSKRRHSSIQRRIILEMIVASVEQEMATIEDNALEEVVDSAVLELRRDKEVASNSLKKKKKDHKDDLQENLTVAILRALPHLLETYKTETGLLRGLTALPKYFLPSVLNTSTQKKKYSALLDQLSSLFRQSTDEKVIANCCLSMTLLAKGDHVRSSETLIVLKRDTVTICEELTNLLADKVELEDFDELMELETSIFLCLFRLSIVSKRWPFSELLEDEVDSVKELVAAVSEAIVKDLNARKLVRDEEDENSEELAPEIWGTAPVKLHEEVGRSISAGMTFLMNVAAWSLQEQLQLEPEERSDTSFVLHMRDLVVRLTSLCFEMYIEDNDSYEKSHRFFSRKIQVTGMRMAGELRSLYPKELEGSPDPFLKSCALQNLNHLIGGSVRFLRSQEEKIRSGTAGPLVTQALLLPFARGLVGNWRVGNRREAGTILAHINGSGDVATSLVSSFSRAIKKEDNVRLLEAHMASLRQVFEDWAESEPEEPASNHPSEEELEEYEVAEEEHQKKFELIEQQAKRLSSSLGVGKLTDKALKPALLGFVREGMRFAFSTDDPSGGEPLFLGARLQFLKILSKYLPWVRKDSEQVAILRSDINEKEAELRNHEEFSEVYDQDLKAIASFRQAGNLGVYLVEDDDDKTKGEASTVADASTAAESAGNTSSFRRRRLSHASSISSIVSKTSTQKSLSPLPEEKEKEDDEKETAGTNDEEQGGDDESTAGSSISSKGRHRRQLKMQSPIEEAPEDDSEEEED